MISETNIIADYHGDLKSFGIPVYLIEKNQIWCRHLHLLSNGRSTVIALFMFFFSFVYDHFYGVNKMLA